MKHQRIVWWLVVILFMSSCHASKKTGLSEQQQTSSEQNESHSSLTALPEKVSKGKNNFLLDYAVALDSNRYNELVDSISKGLCEKYFDVRMAYTRTNYYQPY